MPFEGNELHDLTERASDRRARSLVMELPRLGSMHASRLSFAPTLLRKLQREAWEVKATFFELDGDGAGEARYRIVGPKGVYTLVVFTQNLAAEERIDRVIATQWDLTCALCHGDVTEEWLCDLRRNVPLQEAGRVTSETLVLSRANRSVRNFAYVVDCLAQGEQPAAEVLQRVGYLYRTTAVYGNGKFGLADYRWLQEYTDLDFPFGAQMLVVYLLRHFSIQQVEHMARARSPQRAVGLCKSLQRYLGIGNSTGLGMAPFLVGHPELLDRWVCVRETALERVRRARASTAHEARLVELVRKAQRYFEQVHTDDERQTQCNERVLTDLTSLSRRLPALLSSSEKAPYEELLGYAQRELSSETQELLVSLLFEVHPDAVDGLEAYMDVEERRELKPEATLDTLKQLIETAYDWALTLDFSSPTEVYHFWYRSADKDEPRLGIRGVDAGEEKELPLAIARDVRACYDHVCEAVASGTDRTVAAFVLRHPELRGWVQRIQTMGALSYGEIRANLLSRDLLPLDLLRCKLAFLGATKFDPRSSQWVRVTFFQGAPLLGEITAGEHAFDWLLPTRPSSPTTQP